MSSDFAIPPDAPRFVLANATLPAVLLARPVAGEGREGLVGADLVIADGRIAAILAVGAAPAELPRLDLAGGMLWPCFTDMHTHLDKGHIWEREANPDGTFMGALQAVTRDRDANWRAEDVLARMEFSLRAAYAHGTRLIRTHLDSVGLQHHTSFEVFKAKRAEWQGRIDLQAVSLFSLDFMDDEAFFKDVVKVTRDAG
ncbi:MAG: cytosine deaminase, partial [Ancalomicrobiaceae bacterium]|nr:cytosine deaminase [Ancalomicrobiaceae bacterium]